MKIESEKRKEGLKRISASGMRQALYKKKENVFLNDR